jgi:cytochrome c556
MLSKIRLAALALGFSVLATGAFAQAPEVTQCQDIMKANAASMRALVPMVRGDQPFNGPAVAQAATTIAEGTQRAKSLFPTAPTAATAAGTRAMPAIWERKAELEGYFDRISEAARNVARLAAAGDEAGFKSAFPAVGQTCVACHTSFQRPQ